jgi:hypothetical protein
MAVLSENDRALLWAEFMRDRSGARDPLSLTKADLRAAVNAVDDWLNTNAAAMNTAIPQPARGALTTPQKALLLQFVVARRYLSGA